MPPPHKAKQSKQKKKKEKKRGKKKRVRKRERNKNKKQFIIIKTNHYSVCVQLWNCASVLGTITTYSLVFYLFILFDYFIIDVIIIIYLVTYTFIWLLAFLLTH